MADNHSQHNKLCKDHFSCLLSSSSAHGTDHQDLSRHSYDSVFTAKAIRKKSSEDSVLKETPASRDHYSMGNVYVRAISDFSATQREHLQITKGVY